MNESVVNGIWVLTHSYRHFICEGDLPTYIYLCTYFTIIFIDYGKLNLKVLFYL